MPTCDLCSEPAGAGSLRVSAGEVKDAVRNGLRPPQQVGGMSAKFGLSGSEAERGWVDMVMGDSTDWVLCAACAAASAPYRNSPASSQPSAPSPPTSVPAATPHPVALPTADSGIPFSAARVALAAIRTRAFDAPGPLYNDARRAIMTAWLDGVDRNLRDAQRVVTEGKDANGNAMSRQELAGAVVHMCDEYAKTLTRTGEVCGDAVRAEVERVIGSIRTDAGRLESAAVLADAAIPKPGAPPADPAAIAKAIAEFLRAAAAEAVVPPRALPVMRVIEQRVQRAMKAANLLVGIAFLTSLPVAIPAGNRAHSFWVGLGAFFGALLVVLMIMKAIDRVWIRATIGRLSGDLGIRPEDGIGLFKQLRTERNLIKRLAEQANGLHGQMLSNDLGKRVMEAALLTLIQTRLEPVVAPSRNVAEKKEKWRPVKELADTTKSIYTPMITKCRNFILGVQKLLENREALFETLDRISASVEARSGGGS